MRECVLLPKIPGEEAWRYMWTGSVGCLKGGIHPQTFKKYQKKKGGKLKKKGNTENTAFIKI